MATEPRQIAGMVEPSMGAGGPSMAEDDTEIEVAEDETEELPEGIEIAGEEEVEVEAEAYDHTANLAEVLDEDQFLGELSSDIKISFVKILNLEKIGKKRLPKGWDFLV